MAAGSLTLSIAHYFLLLCLLAIIPFSSEASSCHDKKEIKMNLYLHRIVSGPNATIITVVNPNNTKFSFGTIGVFDHELRVGPKRKSQLIARVQGITVEASLAKTQDRFMASNIVFVEGKFNGSTLAMYGRITVNAKGNTVLSIIAGTGKFLMNRGYVVRVPDFSTSKKSTVAKFDIYIKYYCKKDSLLVSSYE